MNKIMAHLNFVSSTTLMTIPFFEYKVQDELIRFVYVGIQKVSKISLAFLRLYEQVDESEDLEFPLGILSRSIMMDMILMMGVQKISSKYTDHNYDQIKAEIKAYCLKVIADGTKHLIDQVNESENLSDREKNEISIKLASTFPSLFDFTNTLPERKKGFTFLLANIYKESKDLKIEINKEIYHLYDYYSKYDHLSHWTSKLQNENPFQVRKGKLDLSILLIGTHLQNLLALAYDFIDGCKGLLPHIENLKEHEKENFGDDSI